LSSICPLFEAALTAARRSDKALFKAHCGGVALVFGNFEVSRGGSQLGFLVCGTVDVSGVGSLLDTVDVGATLGDCA
jgi:hypothetical protein